jgi:hypothetical protein
MSQKTSIVLTDATPVTPVNRTFAPAKKEENLYTYHNRAGGIVAGYDALSFQAKLPSKTSKATTLTFKVQAPILEQTSASTSTGIQPAPTVAFNDIFKMEFVLHERSSTQNRKDLLAMARDLIDEALVTECVENYDFTYF